MGYGDFSARKDPEGLVKFCFGDVIPIAPFRFSLLAGKSDPVVKPTNVGSTGSYVVRRLREGFVYIYVEAPEEPDEGTSTDGMWHVFRHSESKADVNATVELEETETARGNPNSFHKYLWTENYGRGDWKYSGETQNYCWVPTTASIVWIAYSEFRWPPYFFKQAHDEGFRKKIMQRVNLRGANDWTMKMSEIPDVVMEFKDPSTIPDDIRNELDLSHKPFVSKFVETDEDEDERAKAALSRMDETLVAVSLFDAIGDINELNHRLMQRVDFSRFVSAKNMYPVATGGLCKQIEPSLPKHDGLLDINDLALKDGWDDSYKELVEENELFEEANKKSVAAVIAMLTDESDYMAGMHLDLAFQGAAAATGETTVYTPLYIGQILSTGLEAVSTTAHGAEIIRINLAKSDNVLTSELLFKIVNGFRRMWAGNREKFYKAIRRRTYSFDMVFRRLIPPLARELSTGRVKLADWDKAIAQGYGEYLAKPIVTKTAKLDFKDAVKLLTNKVGDYKTIFVGGEIQAYDTNNNQLPSETEFDKAALRHNKNMKSKMTAEVLRKSRSIPEVEVPYIRETVDVTFHAQHTAPYQTIRKLEVAYASLGTLMSLWALYNLVSASKKMPDKLFEENPTIAALNGNVMNFVATGSWVVEASVGLRIAYHYLPTSSAVISATGLKALYGDMSKELAGFKSRKFDSVFKDVSVSYAESSKAAKARLIAKNLGIVSILLGSVTSAAGWARGVEREDDAESWSYAASLIGGLCFLPGLGWGFLAVGGLIIAAGYVMSLGKYNSVEDVVRTSFWGTTSKYWDLPERFDIDEQIKMAATLVHPDSGSRTFEKQYRGTGRGAGMVTKSTGDLMIQFNEELERFKELTWAPEILNDVPDNNIIVIKTPAISEQVRAKADDDVRQKDIQKKLAAIEAEKQAKLKKLNGRGGTGVRAISNSAARQRQQVLGAAKPMVDLVEVEVEFIEFPDPRHFPSNPMGAGPLPVTHTLKNYTKTYHADLDMMTLKLNADYERVTVTVKVNGRRTNMVFEKELEVVRP